MNKQQAQQLIQDTFETTFDKGRFSGFVRNILNHIEDAPFNYYGNLIPDSYKPYIEKYERIGKYSDGESRIDILIVHLNRENSIERARTMQRNFVAGYLQGKYGSSNDKEAAIVAFVSPDKNDWRFSLVKMDYRFEKTKTGKMKVKEEFTPARRWSFLVGVNEKSHTAQSRLVKILADDEHAPTLAELEEAFNIETVTKEFFLKYRELFLRTKEALDKVVKNHPNVKADFDAKGVDTVNFAKKLLGQIVFLYFLQKKGWFGVGRDDDWGTGSKQFLRELFSGTHGSYQNFFNDILEPLFYEALRIGEKRKQDDYYYSRFNCKIPFLNGGLFDPIGNYDWVHTDIHLPNDLFSNTRETKEGDIGNGILDVFDRYNFTVREDEPLEKEVAIDPELLGKAYEKFNAIRPDNFGEFTKALKSGKKGEENKFNKKFGVYYTPREIVHYMCKQSLINYLTNRAEEAKLKTPISKQDIEDLIEVGEMITEHEATALIKEQNIKNGIQKSTEYTALLSDGIRNNAKHVDNWLADITVCDPAAGSGAFPVGMMNEIVRARNVLSVFLSNKQRNDYEFKRRCIEHSLYGVDIDPGAVEIAKLRLWLSLVVDEEDIKNIKPLPNLDYKIVCGNSLLGVEKDLFNYQLFNNLEKLKPLFFSETNPTKKQEFKKQIDGLISRITNGHTEFDFEVYFSEVFHNKGGFDVAIANPPYVGNKGHKDEFQIIQKGYLGQFYERRMDMLYFFFHLSLNLTKEGASIAFITTNYYPTATGARKLRKDIKDRATIENLVNFNELKIFESALGQHNLITILKKTKNKNTPSRNYVTQRQGLATPEILGWIFNEQDQETNYYTVAQKDLYDGSEYYIRFQGNSDISTNSTQLVLENIKQQGDPLGNLCNANQGIVTGSDKVSKKHIEKFCVEAEVGEGIFVLNHEELKQKQIKTSSEHLKPWYKNSDIQAYWINEKIKEYVLYFKDKKSKQPIEKEVLQHFAKYKDLLIARLSVCKKNKFQWNIVSKWIDRGEYYLLFYPRKQEIFESPKIVAPQRSQSNTFGYTENPWYASADVYFITEKDKSVSLKYVLAILNSKLCYLWLYHRGKRKGETLELYQKPLSEIPIKKISSAEQKPFIDIVDNILAITKDEDYPQNPQKQAEVKELGREIDQMVYQLYDLTEEEKRIVKGEVK